MAKKVFWSSRHKMTEDQLHDLERGLGEKAEIMQYTKTVTDVDQFVDTVLSSGAEVLCVVLPLHVMAEVLERLPPEIPLLTARNARRMKWENGELVPEFVHLGWLRYTEIRIKSEAW